MVRSADWMELGKCREVHPRVMYPHDVSGTVVAKRVCAGCPVRSECLEWALERNEYFGVWGGTSERERNRLRKARRMARYRRMVA